MSDAERDGLRTVTPDGLPRRGGDRRAGLPGRGRPSGLGITLAPAIAGVVAGILEGTIDRETLERLSPTWF